MPYKLLVIPLGYGWARDRRGTIVADAQGEERIKAAIDYGIDAEFHNEDMLYGVLPGVIPTARGGDGHLNLGEAMVSTFTKYCILTERIVRGRANIWGSYMEIHEGLLLGEQMRRTVVFVTSTYHVPRLMLVCREILGHHDLHRKLSRNILNVRDCGNKHASTQDLLVEPVKYVAQAFRIPFGSYMPKTLYGRL